MKPPLKLWQKILASPFVVLAYIGVVVIALAMLPIVLMTWAADWMKEMEE
jgi:hypothetical protein